MNRSRLRHVLMESGLCLDRIRLLEWLLKQERWRVFAFRFLRLRFSPAILESAIREAVDAEEAGQLFSLGMSYVNVGDTYKTTRGDRTVLADGMLTRLAEHFESPTLLEVGVSDANSSLDLLRAKGVFSRVILTDKFSHFFERTIPFGKVFLDSGTRLLGIKFLCFYLNLALNKTFDASEYLRIETINPVVVKESGIHSIDRFDMFEDVLDEPVQLIKCSNILNVSYFTNDQIVAAANNLVKSLVEGGYLVISHNNEKYAQGEALLILRKESGAMHTVESVNNHELSAVLDFGQSSNLHADG